MEDIARLHDRVCCSAISNDVVKAMSSELLNAEQRVFGCVLLHTVTLQQYMSWVYFYLYKQSYCSWKLPLPGYQEESTVYQEGGREREAADGE